MLAE
ncbi:hypothetical protein R5R35_007490 [Gryllus longicercus]|jgi:hypothetical protein